VLHEILAKIAQDPTAYAVAHVSASDPSFDGDGTSGSIFGRSESSLSRSESSFSGSKSSFSGSNSSFSGSKSSFDPERSTSARGSRQSPTSSKTQANSVQSNGLDEYEFDPDKAKGKSQDSPRARHNTQTTSSSHSSGQ